MRYFLKRPAVGAALPMLALGLLAGCDDGVTPQYEVGGTGAVEGLVFFDANGDGSYDPAGGDQALQGVEVVLLQRGTGSALAGAEATSDASGRFRITGVPVGTHDLLIDEASAPEFAIFCQNPQPVSVFLNEAQFAGLDAERSCLVTIAEAEAEPLGTFVTVSGIVTSAPGMIRGGYTHIQDETGGLRLFETALEGRGIEIGDRIEVSGTLAAFGGDLQLTGVTLGSVEEDAADPQPVLVTTGQIAEAALDTQSELLGSFVRVEGAKVVGAFGSNGLNFRNALIDTGDGAAQVRLEAAVAADEAAIAALMTEGRCYDIVGVLGAFNQDGQLFPRTPADIVEVTCQ